MSAYKRFAIQAVYDFVCLSARDKIKNKYLEGKTPKSFDIIVKDLNFPTSRIDEKRDLDLENYI